VKIIALMVRPLNPLPAYKPERLLNLGDLNLLILTAMVAVREFGWIGPTYIKI